MLRWNHLASLFVLPLTIGAEISQVGVLGQTGLPLNTHCSSEHPCQVAQGTNNRGGSYRRGTHIYCGDASPYLFCTPSYYQKMHGVIQKTSPRATSKKKE
jgi:hypothetical protein